MEGEEVTKSRLMERFMSRLSVAFNSQKRFAFLQEVHTHFPVLLPLAAQFYLHESDLLIWGNNKPAPGAAPA